MRDNSAVPLVIGGATDYGFGFPHVYLDTTLGCYWLGSSTFSCATLATEFFTLLFFAGGRLPDFSGVCAQNANWCDASGPAPEEVTMAVPELINSAEARLPSRSYEHSDYPRSMCLCVPKLFRTQGVFKQTVRIFIPFG